MEKKVLIVGGGPAGLAAALELHHTGWKVSIIEKRLSYSRRQSLVIDEGTLSLLNKWNITVPQMKTYEVENGGLFHIAAICDLEEALNARVATLGIPKTHGEFKRFDGEPKKVIIDIQGQEVRMDYDLLIGADGTKSQVKRMTKIPSSHFGTALSQMMLLPIFFPPSKVIIGSIQTDFLHIRKITTPSKIRIVIQTRPRMQPTDFNTENIAQVMRDYGWERDADLIDSGLVYISKPLEVSLEQANKFADHERAVLLVGDAAASTGYFQGTGANTALKAAPILGKLSPKQKISSKVCDNFNAEMQALTDALIEDSRFLFL